jgi:hypothetical protein
MWVSTKGETRLKVEKICKSQVLSLTRRCRLIDLATRQSMKDRLGKYDQDLVEVVMYDECHGAVCPT